MKLCKMPLETLPCALLGRLTLRCEVASALNRNKLWAATYVLLRPRSGGAGGGRWLLEKYKVTENYGVVQWLQECQECFMKQRRSE